MFAFDALPLEGAPIPAFPALHQQSYFQRARTNFRLLCRDADVLSAGKGEVLQLVPYRLTPHNTHLDIERVGIKRMVLSKIFLCGLIPSTPTPAFSAVHFSSG